MVEQFLSLPSHEWVLRDPSCSASSAEKKVVIISQKPSILSINDEVKMPQLFGSHQAASDLAQKTEYMYTMQRPVQCVQCAVQ